MNVLQENKNKELNEIRKSIQVLKIDLRMLKKIENKI